MYLPLIVLAVVLLPVPVIISAIAKDRPPYRAVLEGIFSAAAGAMLIMASVLVSGIGIFDMVMDDVRSTAQVLAGDPGIAQAMGPGLTKSERFDMFVQFYEQAARLFPASICILAAFSSYMEYILLSKTVKRKPEGGAARPMDKLRDFSLPRDAEIYWLGVLFVKVWR